MDVLSREEERFASLVIDRAQNADPQGERLASLIRRTIQRRTGRQIRDLKVHVSDEGILLTGRCSTFYCKQLAQHAAMDASGSEPLLNRIEVTS